MTRDQDAFTVVERPVVRRATIGQICAHALHRSPGFHDKATTVAACDPSLRSDVALREARPYATSVTARAIVAVHLLAASTARSWDEAAIMMAALWSVPVRLQEVGPRYAYRFNDADVLRWRTGAQYVADRGVDVCVADGCDARAGKREQLGGPCANKPYRYVYCEKHHAILDPREKACAHGVAKRTLRDAISAWPSPIEMIVALAGI